MSSNQVAIQFKVSGSDLDAYMSNVQKKSATLANEAIRAATAQTEKGKELLDITNRQLAALEKKAKFDSAAAKAVLTERYNTDKDRVTDIYERQKAQALASAKAGKISPAAYAERLAVYADDRTTNSSRVEDYYKPKFTSIDTQSKEGKQLTALAKEQIETLKQTAKDNVKAISNGDLKLADVIRGASTDEEKLVSKLTQDGLDKNKKPGRDGGGASLVGGLLTIDNLNKFMGSVGQLASTQNGYNLLKPAGQGLGQLVGGLLGGIIGTIIEPGAGSYIGINAGSEIGGMFGSTAGEFKSRQAIAKEEYYKRRNRYNAITGGDPGAMTDLSDVGMSVTDFIQSQSDYARRRGSASGSRKTAMDALYAERGVGVDGATSNSLIEMQRSAKESNRDLASLIGGVIQKGSSTYFKNNDTSFLNEFLSRFAGLQKELLKGSSTVSTGGTYDILSRFNSVGGALATSDPRSSGLISTINNSLSQPGSDMARALSFYALKKNNPNMSLADLIQEQQRGLGSSNYLNSMMGLVDGMGGDESSKRINFAGMLGLSGSQAFASDIYRGYKAGKFRGGFATNELRGLYDFKGRAESNTTDIDRNTAKIQNGLLQDSAEAVAAMADAFKVAVENSMSGAVIELSNGKITFPSRASILQNATMRAGEAKRIHDIPSWQQVDQMEARKNGGVHHK